MYGREDADVVSHSSHGQRQTTSPQPPIENPATDYSDPYEDALERDEEIQHIRSQMEGLERRIANGMADIAYDLLTQGKDPRYIKHERESLAELESKLAFLIHGY
jgi:hypothetical protein